MQTVRRIIYICAAIIPCCTAQAADTWSANVAVTSDYIYRGESLSDGNPAVQGSVDWNSADASVLSGLHASLWGSSVDFGAGDPAKAELSGTVGYGGTIGVIDVDAGITYTAYPGVSAALNYDYLETYISVGTHVGTTALTAAVNYAPAYSGDTGRAIFVNVESETPLNESFAFVGAVGYADLRPQAGENYAYWSAGLKAAFGEYTAGVRYHGTDVKGCGSGCRTRVAFTLARTF